MPEDRPIRWEYDLNQRLFAPRREPLPVPAEGVFDAPDVCLRINAKWVSHLLGVLETLDVDDAWIGTAEEIYDARQEVAKLMQAMALGGCGDEIVDIRIGATGGLEKTYDGTTWIPIGDWVEIAGDTMTGNLTMGSGSASGGKININPTAAQRAINIQLPASYSAEVMRITDSTAVAIFSFGSNGLFSIRNDNAEMLRMMSLSGERTLIFATTPANTVLTVRGRTSHTGTLQNWESAASAILASISKLGEALFSGHIKLIGQSSTQSRDMSRLRSLWEVSTDATRKAQVVISTFDTAEREILRGGTDGTNPKVGFLGATPVLRQVVAGARQQNVAVQSMLTALINLGLITDTTTDGVLPIDGASVELRINAGYIQWRQSDDNPTWANLIALSALQGAQGIQGIQGIQGAQGIQGEQGEPGADGSSYDGQPPAEATTTNGNEYLCAGAFGLTDWLISVVQFNIDKLQLGLTVTETVVEFIDNFGEIGVLVSSAFELVQGIATIGIGLVEVSLTDPAFREDIACRLYCILKEQPSGENKFTEAVFNEWLSVSELPFLGNWAGSSFVTLGTLVIRFNECSRRFLAYSHDVSSECELCEDCPDEPTEWCFEIDFTQTNGSFTTVTDSWGAHSTWEDGTGWVAAINLVDPVYTGDRASFLNIAAGLQNSTYTHIEIDFSYTYGNRPAWFNGSWKIKLGTNLLLEFNADTSGTYTWNGNIVTTDSGSNLFVCGFDDGGLIGSNNSNNPSGGSGVITRIRLAGMGTNPYGTDNC